MKLNGFCRRLFAVLTLTLLLVTAQVPVGSNEAWADTYTNNITCDPKMSNGTHCGPVYNINIHNDHSGEGKALTAGAIGAIAGAIGGSASAIGAVSSAGAVAGLSGAGVTSGLAALGSVVGGGMVAGLAASAVLPLGTAFVVGYGSYKAWELLHPAEKTN